MPKLSFQSITAKNWQACTKLELNPSQKDFVPSNLYSIAEAQFYPDANSKAIYAGEELVGYVLFGQDTESKAWRLFRLMIDQSQQGKNITVLTGAGISQESGIPTFRGTEGLWRNYRPEELATPQAYKQPQHKDLPYY